MGELRLPLTRGGSLLAIGLCWVGLVAAADDDPQVQVAIRRGALSLKSQLASAQTGHAELAVYALLKADESPDDPAIAAVLAKIPAKTRSGEYQPRTHHIYEAAVDLMACEAADPQRFRTEMEAMARYLMAQQKEGGHWYYPNQNDTGGDTSITQYGLLGLWAASRAGIEVPPKVWDRAAQWLVKTQRSDGGFTYHPGEGGINGPGPTTHSMTAAATGSLSLTRLLLHPGGSAAPPTAPKRPSGPKFGVLEKVELDPKIAPASTDFKPTISRAAIDKAAEQSTRWIAQRYEAVEKRWFYYYLYGLERMCALGDIKQIGNHDWYAEGREFLLKNQQPDGSWSGDGGEGVSATSFALLFLTRATRKLIKPRERPSLIGSGLLAGGRGLPDNLNQVNVENGEVRTRKISTPIEALLSELEKPQGAAVPSVAAAIENAPLEDRAALVGQKDRLVRLVRDSRVEARRAAVWALGRTGDLRLAPLLIEALSDPDLGVAVEARDALCALSRRPDGLGLPENPFDSLPEDALPQQREAAESNWRKAAQERWHDWYMQVRPYDERDDVEQLKRQVKTSPAASKAAAAPSRSGGK